MTLYRRRATSPSIARCEEPAISPASRIERRRDEGPPVLERYSLDDSGIVEVVIQDVDSGYERTYRLARS